MDRFPRCSVLGQLHSFDNIAAPIDHIIDEAAGSRGSGSGQDPDVTGVVGLQRSRAKWRVVIGNAVEWCRFGTRIRWHNLKRARGDVGARDNSDSWRAIRTRRRRRTVSNFVDVRLRFLGRRVGERNCSSSVRRFHRTHLWCRSAHHHAEPVDVIVLSPQNGDGAVVQHRPVILPGQAEQQDACSKTAVPLPHTQVLLQRWQLTWPTTSAARVSKLARTTTAESGSLLTTMAWPYPGSDCQPARLGTPSVLRIHQRLATANPHQVGLFGQRCHPHLFSGAIKHHQRTCGAIEKQGGIAKSLTIGEATSPRENHHSRWCQRWSPTT